MKFSVGDKCELVNLRIDKQFNGQPVVVVGLRQSHKWFHGGKGYKSNSPAWIPAGRYAVEGDDGISSVREECLLKLPGDSIPASTLALFTTKQPNPDKVKEKA